MSDTTEAIARHNAMRDEMCKLMEEALRENHLKMNAHSAAFLRDVARTCAETAANFIDPRPTERTEHSSWKYAEEWAHDMINAGKLIRITMAADVTYRDPEDSEDPDDEYTSDFFYVDVLGERP